MVVLADAPRTPLQRVLVERATRWAVEHAAGGAAYLALAPEDGRFDAAALAPEGVELLEQAGEHPGRRMEAAFGEAAARSRRAVALIGTELPVLGAHHAWAAADDLRAGVDVTFGPATDGGYYLVAAREAHPALFAIDPEEWGGERVLELSLRSVLAAGLSVAWLRSERRLRGPGDAAALLADPLAPSDVVAALRA